jgi:hypothetical protein
MMPNTPNRDLAGLQPRGRPRPDEQASAVQYACTDDDPPPEWSRLLGPVHHVDQRWLRQVNRALVLACVRKHGPVSRVKIAEHTALSRTTVSAIINALLGEGIVREGEHVPSTTRGGRRAVLLHAMMYVGSTTDTPAGDT